MLRHCLAALGLFSLPAAALADAPGPLVSPEWVAEHACDDGVVALDLRASPRSFRRARIFCSVNSSYSGDGWRVAQGRIPGMLPEPAALAELIGALGIGNDDHVIVVGPGGWPGAATIATRVYWTFKAIGHDAVSLLDGGFAAFRADSSLPLENGPVRGRAPQTFAAALRPELLATADDVAAAAESGVRLIDARESEYFVGVNKAWAAARPGTLPGAANVPLTWLVTPDGRFQPPEILESIVAHTALDREAPLIAFCNSGQMASLDWFVAHELLGNDRARVYDGSLAEWTADPARPVERRIGGE